MKIGYFCTFTPKELIQAAGFTPIRIFASNKPISLASAYIQSYACSQSRGSLERVLDGDLKLDGCVFTRCCDTLMRLADIWEFSTKMPVYNIEFPTRIDDKSKEFYFRELKDFVEVLKKWGGDITKESLKESIEAYKNLETRLKEIFETSPNYELAIKVQEMSVFDALKILESQKDVKDGPKVLLTGSVCPYVEIYEMLEDVGFRIVDDLCTGSRFFTFEYPDIEIRSIEDGLRYIVEKYFSKAPCPTKHYENDRRLKYLIDVAKDCDGVIFLLVKFCDPHFFDYPQLKAELEKMGKKVLLLEIEFPITSTEQIRTRVEAFYEVLV